MLHIFVYTEYSVYIRKSVFNLYASNYIIFLLYLIYIHFSICIQMNERDSGVRLGADDLRRGSRNVVISAAHEMYIATKGRKEFFI